MTKPEPEPEALALAEAFTEAWTLVFAIKVAPTFTLMPGMLMLLPGGLQPTDGGVQLHPAGSAAPAVRATSARTRHPVIPARIDLTDAFMATLLRAQLMPKQERRRPPHSVPPWDAPDLVQIFPARPMRSLLIAREPPQMFHLNTEQLIDYWRRRRGSGPMP